MSDPEIIRTQISSYLMAWAEDQRVIARDRTVFAERERFMARAEALVDAARQIEASDDFSTDGFLQP